MANVIEITLRGKDETKALAKGIQNIKAGLVGLVAGFSAGGLFKLFTKNIIEAEKATAQLDAAFASTGKVVGVTRKSLDDLASSLQKTTTFGDDLVKEAEAILLTFNRVRGEAFGRTITVATDLSARMGTDLVTAVRTLGIALSDPEKGFDRLRRSGIVVSKELKEVVANLVKTGQVSKAQNVILTELENKFKGSAAAARNTLGGALAGLNNAFGDLFESTTEGTSGTVKAINSLAESLSDPRIKKGLDTLVSGFSSLLGLTVRLTAETGNLIGKMYEFATGGGIVSKAFRDTIGTINPIAGALLNNGALAAGATRRRTRGPTGAARGRGSRGVDASTSLDSTPAVKPEEVNLIKAARIELGAYRDLLVDLNNSTKTASEQQVAAYYEMKEALKLLREEGVITQQQAGERIGEFIDDTLLIDIGSIKSMYKDVKVATTELGEFMKGVWRSAGESIRGALSDAIYEGKLSLKSLVDIGRRVVADLISAFAVSGLKNLFTGNYTKGGGVLAGLASAFGFSAGGGSTTRPRWVGEEGRELVVPGRGGMSVYNKRQLAGMGGGGSTFSPVTNITLIEREDPEQTKREVLETVALQNSKQMAEFQRTLNRNGLEVK